MYYACVGVQTRVLLHLVVSALAWCSCMCVVYEWASLSFSNGLFVLFMLLLETCLSAYTHDEDDIDERPSYPHLH